MLTPHGVAVESLRRSANMLGLRRRRGENGAAAVEFALIMIPFFVMIFGLIEYGWYFYVGQNTSGAASTLTRKLQVGDCWASGAALTFAQNQSSQVTGVTINPASTGSAPVDGSAFTVTVTANASLLNFLPLPGSGTITRTVSAEVDDNVAQSC